LGAGGKVQAFLEKSANEVDLAAALEGFHPFFVAITVSPSKIAVRCSNSVKSRSLEGTLRAEQALNVTRGR